MTLIRSRLGDVSVGAIDDAGGLGVSSVSERNSSDIWVYLVIVKALKGIDPAAAKKFVELYLGELVENEEKS